MSNGRTYLKVSTKLSKKIDTTGTILNLSTKPKKERDIRVDTRNKLKVLFLEDPRLSIRISENLLFMIKQKQKEFLN